MCSKFFYRLLLMTFFGFFFFIVFSCEESKKQVRATRITTVSGEEREFQEAMERMEEIKSEINKYDDIYERAIKTNRSILDTREAQIAAEQALRRSQDLNSFVTKCLNNNEVIRQVTNAENQYQDYRKFANKIINKYESILE